MVVKTENISVDLARPTSAGSISQVAISLASKSNIIFPVRDAASDVRLLILGAPCATILLATGRPLLSYLRSMDCGAAYREYARISRRG